MLGCWSNPAAMRSGMLYFHGRSVKSSAPSEVRDELAAMFFFEPEPYIQRVIFVTTAHRGSRLARHIQVSASVSD